MVILLSEAGSTLEVIASNGWLSKFAETRFIEEEEAGGSTVQI
jgi:hypothetical protein